MTLTGLPYFSGFDEISSEYRNKFWQDARPRYFTSEKPTKAVVICLHGFTGTPYGVHPVGEACFSQGMDAVTPMLPGHGYAQVADQRREFPKITMEGMFEAARKEIYRARQTYEFVGMFGLSMGGAIALTMAAEGLVDACATAAPALRLPMEAEILIPLLGWASFWTPSRNKQSFYLPTYNAYHSHSLRELRRISRYARKKLPKIQSPTLVVHSQADPTIPAVVANWIQAESSGQVEVAWFNQSGHCMLRDVQGKQVSDTVAKFFKGVSEV